MNNGAYRVNTTSPIESTAARSRQRRFEMLVRTYSADLGRFGCRLCHDQVLAEDLVQETFLRAWNSLDSLRDAKAGGLSPYSDGKMPGVSSVTGRKRVTSISTTLRPGDPAATRAKPSCCAGR